MKVLSRNHNKYAVQKSGTQPVQQQPSAWLLLRIWGTIGLQSFGGGASTLFLIQHEFMDKRNWLTQEEFNRLWSLCLMTPGINIIAVTVLIGRKLGGFRGIVASLVGLLLPSAAITCLLTAGFQVVENSHIVQAILRGVIPATGGIMLLVGMRFAVPLLKQGRVDGLLKLSISLAIIAGVAVTIIVFKIMIPLVLLCAALVGIAFFSAAPSSLSPLAEATSAEEKQ
jgi:chromate transporter